MAIRELHEQLLMADERVREAQKALDEAIREHWMASQARVKAEQEYYVEVQRIKATAKPDGRMLAAALRGAATGGCTVLVTDDGDEGYE